MAGLIKDNVNEWLNILVGDMFAMNRLLDRQMSILSVTFVMNNTEKHLHVPLSHSYPILSDKISDYQTSRNCLTVYPETPKDDSDYNSPLDVFNKMLEKQLYIEDHISEAMLFVFDEGDMMTYAFLQKFLLGFNKYSEQIMLLVDKASNYNDNWMAFDHDIKKFIIL